MVKPFKLIKSEDDKFYFVLRSGNNKILMTSETYETHSGAVEGILAVLRIARKFSRLKWILHLLITDTTKLLWKK